PGPGTIAAWPFRERCRSNWNRITMTAAAEHTETSHAPSPPLSTNPYIGILGVFLGAATSTLNGRLLSTGLADLRGALGYGFDGASWIPTALNMGIMFTGVFEIGT